MWRASHCEVRTSRAAVHLVGVHSTPPRKQSMLAYLPGFAPWIVAGVLSSFDWRWGAIGGLVTGLLMMLNDRRRGVGFDALVLEISTLAYFVVIGAVSVARPDSSLADHTDVISF